MALLVTRLITFMLLAFTFNYGYADTIDGNSLLEFCNDTVKILNQDLKYRDDSELANSSMCIGFVDAISVALVDTKAACLPINVSNAQYARIVLKYLLEHPAQLSYSGSSLASIAIRQALPCNLNHQLQK